jgi:hypothetical protein
MFVAATASGSAYGERWKMYGLLVFNIILQLLNKGIG